MGNSIDKEINDLLWRLEYIGKYTSKMREEKSIEITKLTEVEKLDAIYHFKQEISNYEKNKKSIMDKIIDRDLGHKLIDRLYDSGNLSLKECGYKRDELNKLKKDQIDDFINGLPNAKHFLSELTRSKEQTEFKGVFERKWMKDKKSKSDKNIDGFVNIFFFGHFNKTARAFVWWLIGTYTTFRIYSVIIRLANGDSPADKFVEYAVFLIFFMSLSFITYKIKSLKKWLFKIYLKRKKEKTQVLKKAEAVKQLKEAKELAVKELKEAKELLDLGILSQTEYDEKAKKLKPIILDN
jgi:hypothetical protein